jgi:hypothetical protein
VLVRIIERKTERSWMESRSITERIHLGGFESKDGRILQRTEFISKQSNILKLLKIQKIDLKA